SRHLPKEQERRGRSFGPLAAHLVDEFPADAVIGEMSAEGAQGRTDGGTQQRHEEEQPEKEAPKGAVAGAGAGEVAGVPRFGFLLADGPGDRRHIDQLQQLLFLQAERNFQSLFGPVGSVKLQDHYRCCHFLSSFSPALLAITELAAPETSEARIRTTCIS